MKTRDTSRRLDRIEEELDNILIEIQEARQEVRELSGTLATLRQDIANRRCTGGTPAPAHPTPPTNVPYIRPWQPYPHVTWCTNESGHVRSGYMAPVL